MSINPISKGFLEYKSEWVSVPPCPPLKKLCCLSLYFIAFILNCKFPKNILVTY